MLNVPSRISFDQHWLIILQNSPDTQCDQWLGQIFLRWTKNDTFSSKWRRRFSSTDRTCFARESNVPAAFKFKFIVSLVFLLLPVRRCRRRCGCWRENNKWNVFDSSSSSSSLAFLLFFLLELAEREKHENDDLFISNDHARLNTSIFLFSSPRAANHYSRYLFWSLKKKKRHNHV